MEALRTSLRGLSSPFWIPSCRVSRTAATLNRGEEALERAFFRFFSRSHASLRQKSYG
jgi:hypothetical protein